MRNIGPRSSEWLLQAGIADVDGLRSLGAVEAYLRVRSVRPQVSLNLLYALEGAILDTHWLQVPPSRRRQLRQMVDASH